MFEKADIELLHKLEKLESFENQKRLKIKESEKLP